MAEIETLLQDAVAKGVARGIAVTAGDSKGVLLEAAAGERAPGQPMAPDTVVWIASMTKAITATAALMQVERGRLTLDGPIREVLPDLAEPNVLTGFAPEGGEPMLRPARRPITLRHLLTHTSGFSYDIWNPEIGAVMAARGIPGIIGCQRAALTTPLVADPGERWEYGIGIDWAGLAVETVTGKRLGEVLREEVLGPLGMADTGFRLGAAQRTRLSDMHARGEDGSLAAIPFEVPQDPEFEMGGGGLYGTVRDYLRFCRMWLNRGVLDGARILSEAMAAEAMRDSIAPLEVTPMRTALPGSSHDVELFPGMRKGWGLSFLINEKDVPGMRAAGSLAWAGLANTYYWIDPKRDRAGVIATQQLPFADPKVLATLDAFERAVYAG
ncbi:serine hydrolase domain-containing protein [Paracraurococcus ruber]|uniref:1,4-butanediol diacrylate esterase n=1 Tax=Paracraurococcus ruber TaxID=77675 RepID=A0ABS1D0E6_9PROT|nr:serine hydrolase domain-containing protein [Paracraurococcus ruber]MBK1660278.1 1,4-butanediol diacrylate esterase [Paracraurococcus ruber]TDG31584.1 class A beta-lactamase-related serine hydrolase [Paracraurococcus ruber]